MQKGDEIGSFAGRLGGGASQAGARAYNERLVLLLLRRNGPLPKAELARQTGLSAQTLTTMMRRLEGDGLVAAQEPLRGRIGQPSVPYALDPTGAYSFGVKIGRRSLDVVLCDFLGEIIDRAKQTYSYPEPDKSLRFVERQVRLMRQRASRPNRVPERVIGIGVSMPSEIWKWVDEVEAPIGALDGWRSLRVPEVLQKRTGLPVWLVNDATAACGAELARSERGGRIDMLYVFIGSFIGGGVVLNGTVVTGRSGNAGALGSMPVNVAGLTQQLIRHASIITLEKALKRAGIDPAILQHPERRPVALGAPLAEWIDVAGATIGHAIVAAMATLDFQRVRVDGALPQPVLADLLARISCSVAAHDLQGLSQFEITQGTLGDNARALGGALLPIHANFGVGPDVLLKSPVAEQEVAADVA
jgi:predicted NBD/HSP70 family sugar kinase/biotin operon repressor